MMQSSSSWLARTHSSGLKPVQCACQRRRPRPCKALDLPTRDALAGIQPDLSIDDLFDSMLSAAQPSKPRETSDPGATTSQPKRRRGRSKRAPSGPEAQKGTAHAAEAGHQPPDVSAPVQGSAAAGLTIAGTGAPTRRRGPIRPRSVSSLGSDASQGRESEARSVSAARAAVLEPAQASLPKPRPQQASSQPSAPPTLGVSSQPASRQVGPADPVLTQVLSRTEYPALQTSFKRRSRLSGLRSPATLSPLSQATSAAQPQQPAAAPVSAVNPPQGAGAFVPSTRAGSRRRQRPTSDSIPTVSLTPHSSPSSPAKGIELPVVTGTGLVSAQGPAAERRRRARAMPLQAPEDDAALQEFLRQTLAPTPTPAPPQPQPHTAPSRPPPAALRPAPAAATSTQGRHAVPDTVTLSTWPVVAAAEWPSVYSRGYHTCLYEFLFDVWGVVGKDVSRSRYESAHAAVRLLQQCWSSPDQLVRHTAVLCLVECLADSWALADWLATNIPNEELVCEALLPLVRWLLPEELGHEGELQDFERLAVQRCGDRCRVGEEWGVLMHKLDTLQPAYPAVGKAALLSLYE